MTSIAISQPMFLPWSGFFEHVSLVDFYVHYDDVQFSKGSFTNRVQLKSDSGSQWLTVPLQKFALGTPINQIRMADSHDWRVAHRTQIADLYRDCSHWVDVESLLDGIYQNESDSLNAFVTTTFETLCASLPIDKPSVPFSASSELDIQGSSSKRVLDIVQHFGADVYITGHGARKYLDHELFEQHSVEVRYVDYSKSEYEQRHGTFTPYVSILDAIANVGMASIGKIFQPRTIHWRDFLDQHK